MSVTVSLEKHDSAEDVVDTPVEAAGAARRRRKASRAAGPAGPAAPAAAITLDKTSDAKSASAKTAAKTTRKRSTKPKTPPPRRQPNRRLVNLIAYPVVALTLIALAIGTALLYASDSKAQAEQAREQRFIDTASQTVINMFSYTPDTIDDSVNRFVAGTSGPLRDMLSINNNVDNLKAMFSDTNATSEAVVNAAALEQIDEVAKNASVLVTVRVTVTDIDGVNKPSMPYRMRVIVNEDDNGHMTGYDIKYPEGGN